MGFLSQNKRRLHLRAGFTLVEVLIIAPVVIIAISGFIALMVSLVGDVLVTRDQNNLMYETQDALDRIEQDTRLSTQFLTTSGTQIAPQGSDSNFTGTAAFSNSGSTLILGSLTTDKTPSDPTRKLVYYTNQPYTCNSSQVGYNRVFLSKVIYFIKNGSLWRRAILPDYNTNVTPDDFTICSVPWQRNTCSPGYAPATRCQTNDSEVMANVSSFSIKYYSTPSGTIDIGSAQAQAASTIEVTLNGQKTTGGRSLTSTGSVRATKLNSIDVDTPIPAVPVVTGQSNATSAVFSWDYVPLASSYLVSYNINGGSWSNVTLGAQTTSYTVNASLGDTVTLRVSAKNTAGTSSYGQASVTIPVWHTCNLQNNWINYDTVYTTPGYTKTNNDVVVMKGLIKNGTATSGTTLCRLPVGYRPSAQLAFHTNTSNAGEGTTGRVDVLPTGEVIIVSGNNGWFSLDSIRFIASTAPYSWTDLTTTNGWSNVGSPYSDLKSTLDSTGRAHIQGVVKNGTYTNPTTITTLPANTQSSKYNLLPVASGAAFNYASISALIEAKGINPNSFYSVQAMYYPAAFAGWSTLTLNSSAGWQVFDSAHTSPQYTKSADGIVTVRGFIKNGTTTVGTALATLPPGYRPKERVIYSCVANGSFCRVDILPSGTIEIRSASATWTSLDGLNFIAEQ